MSHTPGPWTLRPMSMNIDGYGVEAIVSDRIAQTICTGTKTIEDAHLIAVAPQMLGMLYEVSEVLEDPEYFLDAAELYRKVQSVINQAKGIES